MGGGIQVPTMKFVIVACEASGDLLGEGLAGELKKQFPGCTIEGIGGERMEAAGVRLWHHYEVLNVMGIVEVLKHLPRLLRLRREVVERTLAAAPDAYIGIDGPDFNLGVEKRLRAKGTRTVHYVSPSIWAWRESRAEKIKACADRVLCLFPMEPPIYARYGMPATYIGHPLADTFEQEPDKGEARKRLNVEAEGLWLGLLPGSRVGEVEKLGRIFMQAALLVRRKHPNLKILVPMANSRSKGVFLKVMDALHEPQEGGFEADEIEWGATRSNTSVIDGQSHDVMKAADVLLLASGTAALEGMLAKRPMAVAYRVAPLTYWIVKGLGILKIDRYSLPNILANRSVVPELMQDGCTAEGIAETLLSLIDDKAKAQAQVEEFHAQHERLRGSGSAGAAAAVGEVARTR